MNSEEIKLNKEIFDKLAKADEIQFARAIGFMEGSIATRELEKDERNKEKVTPTNETIQETTTQTNQTKTKREEEN